MLAQEDRDSRRCASEAASAVPQHEIALLCKVTASAALAATWPWPGMCQKEHMQGFSTDPYQAEMANALQLQLTGSAGMVVPHGSQKPVQQRGNHHRWTAWLSQLQVPPYVQ